MVGRPWWTRGIHTTSTVFPRKLVLIVGGNLIAQFCSAAALGACVAAYGGEHVSFATLIFINVSVSTLSAVVPVPGGTGVMEAGLSAGLAAAGVASDIAVSAALTYRFFSFSLPPAPGWFATRWLTRHDYL